MNLQGYQSSIWLLKVYQHVSGFYFLKCSDKTSYPVFHEPKTGARCTKLKMKPDLKGVWAGHEQFHLRPKPGTLIIFPGYLEHEYAVDFGIEPFRFIHWNIQACLLYTSDAADE